MYSTALPPPLPSPNATVPRKEPVDAGSEITSVEDIHRASVVVVQNQVLHRHERDGFCAALLAKRC
jgi:hypothetical protein